MSPMPVRMRDRWQNRRDQAPGQGTVYWHMLVHDYPEVRSAVAEAQQRLAQFSGLHMTPPRWLHMTTLIAGSASDITSEQMAAMIAEAQRALADIEPIRVSIDKILYHPEAIMIGVHPRDALTPVLRATQAATQKVTGNEGQMNGSLPEWTPHITVSYSTADQPAGPIISALGTKMDRREIAIRSVSLVTQWGPERRWDWQPIGTALLGPAAYER
jgi:2'-5' RNA ligase